MHIGNEIVSPTVASTFIAVSSLVILYSSNKVKKSLEDSNIPLMGVMGAFVFAAQMVNFQILPATSGHLVGTALLSILFGPHISILIMSSILIVQAFVFQDGGIIALGVNIFNMGVLPSFASYYIYKIFTKKTKGNYFIYLGSYTSAFIGVLTGAFCVPFQLYYSNISEISFNDFFFLMIGIHLLIALVEGLLTTMIIAYLFNLRPELSNNKFIGKPKISYKFFIASLVILIIFVAGFLALLASSDLDGLEYVLDKQKIQVNENNLSPIIKTIDDTQNQIALLPDYSIGNNNFWLWTSFSGLIGSLITFIIIYLVGKLSIKNKSS